MSGVIHSFIIQFWYEVDDFCLDMQNSTGTKKTALLLSAFFVLILPSKLRENLALSGKSA